MFGSAISNYKKAQGQEGRYKTVMGKISESERKTIIERIRSLAQEHAEAGVDTDKRAICHNCGHAKPLTGSVHYGRYRLCNDCALRYELAKAQGDVEKVEDFVLAE
jgi:hypothetical protein